MSVKPLPMGVPCGTVLELERPSSRVASEPPGLRGAGDLVAVVVKAATLGFVKPCGGCLERQAWLNQAVPFGAATDTMGEQSLGRK